MVDLFSYFVLVFISRHRPCHQLGASFRLNSTPLNSTQIMSTRLNSTHRIDRTKGSERCKIIPYRGIRHKNQILIFRTTVRIYKEHDPPPIRKGLLRLFPRRRDFKLERASFVLVHRERSRCCRCVDREGGEGGGDGRSEECRGAGGS